MRSKLKLQLEDLAVDSFDTTSTEKPKGTVFGEQCTCHTQCTCPGCPTCDQNTCDYSCGTCNHSCDQFCTMACTQGFDATCRNIGTCDGNYYCPATP